MADAAVSSTMKNNNNDTKKKKRKNKQPPLTSLVPPPKAARKAKGGAAAAGAAADFVALSKKQQRKQRAAALEVAAVEEVTDEAVVADMDGDDDDDEKVIVVETSPGEIDDDMLRDAVEAAHADASANVLDADARARNVFRALLAPLGVEPFYKEAFQAKAVLIARDSDYLDGWLTSTEVLGDALLGGLAYGDVELTQTFEDGRLKSRRRGLALLTSQETKRRRRPRGASDESAVDPAFVRGALEEHGATLRISAAEAHFGRVHELCAALEDEFGATVEGVAELAPVGTRGSSALRALDGEAFILQLEGRAKYGIHAPATAAPALDLDALGRMTEDSLEAAGYGEATDEVEVEPGDVLYLPRGFARSSPAAEKGQPTSAPTDEACLQLILVTHRDDALADFLEALMPVAIRNTAAATPELRLALPRDATHYLGIQHANDDDDDEATDQPPADKEEGADDDDEDDLAVVQAVRYDASLHRSAELQRRRRRRFADRIADLVEKVAVEAKRLAAIDDAADDLARRFVASRLPPPKAPDVAPMKLNDDTRLYASGRRTARLCVEEDRAVVYHSLGNGRVRRGAAVAALEFELDDAPAIEALLASHASRPLFVRTLPHASRSDRLGIAKALYDAGLLHALKEPAGDDDDERGSK